MKATLTTPPAGVDVTVLFPGIADFAETATRLHPRPGTPDPYGSHIGGPLCWPAGEPWPACVAPHLVPTEVPLPAPLLDRIRAARADRNWAGYSEAIATLATDKPGFAGIDRRAGSALYYSTRPEPVPCPLVPVAQLHAADVPDLRPPPGHDLLHLLWCPNEHQTVEGSSAPAVTLRWRRATDGDTPRSAEPTVSTPAYLPRPCVLQPEQVTEYPWWQQLPADLGQRVRQWDADRAGRYHRQLAAAPGWKVGGWPRWPTTDPRAAYCTGCGHPMRQLLQVDSAEWGDAGRWRPAGETAATAEPTGVIAGETGLLRVFACAACPDEPALVDLQ